MGLADRNYDHAANRGSGTMASIPPLVKALLITNGIVFILDHLVFVSKPPELPPILTFGAFTIDSAIYQGQIWEFITFQFLHANLLHLLFNSMGLYFFGPLMERAMGVKRFLIYYLLCGAAGAGFYTLITLIGIIPYAPEVPLVGASAGIYGIFAGVAVIAPQLRVQLLFPPIELSMRQLAIALLVIALVYILFNLDNAGGEAGHLGGAILGFFLTRRMLRHGRHPVDFRRPRAFSRPWKSKLSPRTHIDLDQATEVDRILEKISRDGFQSLTDEEKQTLKRAAER